MKVDTKSAYFLFYDRIIVEVNDMRKNRKFSAEFKLQCIKEVVEEHKSRKEVCRKYQLDSHQLRKWIEHY